MSIVYGNSTVSGIQIAEVSSWGSTSALGGSWLRIPLVSARDADEVETIPVPEEISASGGNPGTETASRIATGEFTTRLDIGAYWFWLLMRHAMGSEVMFDSINIFTGSAIGFITHQFIPQSYLERNYANYGGRGKGLLFQIMKAGESAATDALCEQYEGVQITGFTLTQPADTSPTITWRWMSKPSNPIDITTVSVETVNEAERKIVGIRDLFAVKLEGSGDVAPTDVTLQSFSLTMDKPYEFAPQFLTELGSTNLQQPGFTGAYDVTFDMETPLVAGSGYVTNNPLALFNAGTTGRAIRIIYNTSSNYFMDFTVPDVIWTAAEAPIESNDALIISASGRGRMSYMRRTGTTQAYRKWAFHNVSNRDYKAAVIVQVTNQRGTTYDYNGGETPHTDTSNFRRFSTEPHGSITAPAGIPNVMETMGYWFLQETGDETSTAQLAGQNQDTSGAQTLSYRIRFLVKAWGTCTNISQKLQYDLNGSGTWNDVTGASSVVQMNTTSGLTDGSDCTKLMSGEDFYTSNLGQAETDGTACDLIDPTAGQTFECIFAVTNQDADLDVSDQIQFRLENGTVPNRAAVIPTFTCT